MSDPFIGQITAFGFNFTPRGWGSCAGGLLPITQNAPLYALIGTIYGGDGRATMGLPDLRSRVPVGRGTGPGLSTRELGQRGGHELTYLTNANTPAHSHTAVFTHIGGQHTPVAVAATNEEGDSATPTAGAYLAQPPDISGPDKPALMYKNDPSAASLVNLGGVSGGEDTSGGTVTISPYGPGTPFSTLDPYLALNFCIAMTGQFPSRS